MTDPSYRGRYVFVAGLHRTGTSLTARLLSRSPHIASIENSPAPENEGCYLQGAIPHTALHGVPGQFATDPSQHHVEGGKFDTLETRNRLASDWNPWFAPADAPWRVEKSPVNLTRMRLYQQLFPTSQFIVVLRHPSAMAAALAKWVDRPARELIDHALDAYERMANDLEFLHAAMVVRYEDLIAQPERWLDAMFAFLGLDLPEMGEALNSLRDGNADYPDAQTLTPAQSERAAKWGYGDNLSLRAFTPVIQHPLRTTRENVLEALYRPQ